MDNNFKQVQAEQNRTILGQFGQDPIEKSISVGEFKERYETGHDVFTEEKINEFKSDLGKAIVATPEKEPELMEKAVKDLEGLSRVLVKNEDETRVTAMYVRKSIVSEEIVETPETPEVTETSEEEE